jgi:hypothetical protein
VDGKLPDISEPLRNVVVKRTILASALAWFRSGNSSRRGLREIEAGLESVVAGTRGRSEYLVDVDRRVTDLHVPHILGTTQDFELTRGTSDT